MALPSPAAADYNDGHRGYDRGRNREITIRMNHSQFSVDRGDRLFYRLTDRPYNFRPGYTYAYTDDCKPPRLPRAGVRQTRRTARGSDLCASGRGSAAIVIGMNGVVIGASDSPPLEGEGLGVG
ncbi:MAG: hypothetical protein WDM79_08805 [Terricaulis sp.]